MKRKVHQDMVGSWGRSEVGSAPSSNLVKRQGKSCGQKMEQPSLKTGTPSSDQGLVRRWGRPVLRPGRLEDGAQHLHHKGSMIRAHCQLMICRGHIGASKGTLKNFLWLTFVCKS